MTNEAHPGPQTARLLLHPGLADATLPGGVSLVGEPGPRAHTTTKPPESRAYDRLPPAQWVREGFPETAVPKPSLE